MKARTVRSDGSFLGHGCGGEPWPVERAGVDVVHGHSSHPVKGVEVHRGRLILYGCGDLVNDCEGIGGHEEYRPDLALLSFPSVDPETGELERLGLVPTQVRRMRLHRATEAAAAWLHEVLERESGRFGVSFTLDARHGSTARW